MTRDLRAEVVGIGTEILLGQIANSNARVISERLAEIGVDVLHHQAVGDNVGRIAGALRLAASRADVVVVTGGLGPTGDDVTREAIAEAMGLELERHPEIEDFLRGKFRRIGREMPGSNLRQAMVPRGARYILPDRGTAPGLVVDAGGGGRLYAVPGVPAEMVEMLEGTIVPEVSELGGRRAIASRVLRVTGVAEAKVGEILEDLFESHTNPTVAYLASAGEVRVRLTAKAGSRGEAEALILPVEEEVRRRLGDAVFGADEEVLEEVVGRLLRERGLTLACAESLTGGSLGARITSVAGASAYFRGSAVCYAPEAKASILGVPKDVLDRGTVTEECALAMARGARQAFDANVAVATTGVAGPDHLEGQPRGTVWVALADAGTEAARTFVAPGDRDQVRRWAEQGSLELLRRHLLGLPAR